ncbi:MAG: ABC transporter permease subunit [bacterium]|nr:ABC transporter permease subunit [bacterium]
MIKVVKAWKFDQAIAKNISKIGRIINKETLLAFLAFFLLLVIWWLISAYFSYDLIPDPKIVISETIKLFYSQEFYYNLFLTLKRIFFGFSISFLSGIVISILICRSNKLESILKGPILLGLIIPSIIFAFVSIVLLGAKEVTALLIIFLITTPQLIVIISSGLKNINPEFTEVGEIFQINFQSKFFDIILPQIAPSFFAAVKTGIANTWKGTIVAEIFALANGIGSRIYDEFGLFSLKGVLSWALAFILILSATYFVINLIEKKLLKWQYHYGKDRV